MDQPQGPATLGRPAEIPSAKPLDTNAPGAGLNPPPPPEQPYAPPPPAPQAYTAPPAEPMAGQPPYQSPQPGYGQPPQAYQPPPQGYQPPQQQYGPPPGAGYGQPVGQPYGAPPDGNTSGMGAEYPAPPEASGWTFAGFVPFGIFAFVMGNVMWGVIGLVVCIIPVLNYIAPLVYGIYVGLNGKKLAWQGKRFDSMEQYAQAMRNWNIAGMILLIVIIVLVGFVTCAFVATSLMGTGGNMY